MAAGGLVECAPAAPNIVVPPGSEPVDPTGRAQFVLSSPPTTDRAPMTPAFTGAPPSARLRTTAAKARACLETVDAPGVGEIGTRVSHAVTESRGLVEALKCVSRAGLRGRASETPVGVEEVRYAVEAVRDAPVVLAEASAATLGERYAAFRAAPDTLPRACRHRAASRGLGERHGHSRRPVEGVRVLNSSHGQAAVVAISLMCRAGRRPHDGDGVSVIACRTGSSTSDAADDAKHRRVVGAAMPAWRSAAPGECRNTPGAPRGGVGPCPATAKRRSGGKSMLPGPRQAGAPGYPPLSRTGTAFGTARL